MAKKITKIKATDYPKAILAVGKSSLLKGEVGVFILRDIKEQSLINKVSDFDESVLVSWTEFKKLDKITQKKLTDFCVQTDSGFLAPKNLNNLTIIYHINHSCDPNVYIDKAGNYVSTRFIKKGEELFVNFSSYMETKKFKMVCSCGSKKCKKTITGMSDKEFEEYQKNIEKKFV